MKGGEKPPRRYYLYANSMHPKSRRFPLMIVSACYFEHFPSSATYQNLHLEITRGFPTRENDSKGWIELLLQRLKKTSSLCHLSLSAPFFSSSLWCFRGTCTIPQLSNQPIVQQQHNAENHTGTDQEHQLISNMRMKKKGATMAWMLGQEGLVWVYQSAYLLGIYHTNVCRVYTEWCKKKKKHWVSLVDKRVQRKKGKNFTEMPERIILTQT